MKTFKVLRIYKLEAEDRLAARKLFKLMLEEGREDELFEVEIVKEEEPKGFLNQIKKQVLG